MPFENVLGIWMQLDARQWLLQELEVLLLEAARGVGHLDLLFTRLKTCLYRGETEEAEVAGKRDGESVDDIRRGGYSQSKTADHEL